MLLGLGGVINEEAEDTGNEVGRHGDVEVDSETVLGRVIGSVEGAADEQTKDSTERVGSHISSLAIASPASWKNLRCDSVKKRLDTEGDTDNTETRNDRVHGLSSSYNNAANSTKEGKYDEQPFATPVVSSLGDDGAKNDSHDSDWCGNPDDILEAIEVSCDSLTLLLR